LCGFKSKLFWAKRPNAAWKRVNGTVSSVWVWLKMLQTDRKYLIRRRTSYYIEIFLLCLRFLLLINLTVSAFATQLGKIGFAYPDFVIIVAISL
jgi:hypothetical protein